jgi:hypothetical protein
MVKDKTVVELTGRDILDEIKLLREENKQDHRDLDSRLDAIEKQTTKTNGTVKMLKGSTAVLGTIVLSLTGWFLMYVIN